MASLKNAPTAFLLDSKGLCFLCFEEVKPAEADDCGGEEEEETHPNVVSFAKLASYIKVNFSKVFDLSVAFELPGILDKSELFVSLCHSCHSECHRFLKFHQELEVIHLQLTSCVASIQKKLQLGEKHQRVKEYRRRLEGELLQTELISNLRTETNKSCTKSSLNHCQRYLPTVAISKLAPSQIPARLPPPQADSLPASPPPEDTQMFQDLMQWAEEDTADPESSSEVEVKCLIDLLDSDNSDDEFTPSSPSKSIRGPKGDQIYPCTICGRYLPLKELDAHSRRHKYANSQPCTHCNSTFPSRPALNAHLNLSHFELRFLPFKEPYFPGPYFKALVDLQLNSVVRVHQVPKAARTARNGSKYNYECVYCKAHLMYESTIRGHLITAHFDRVREDVILMQANPQLELFRSHALKLAKSPAERELVMGVVTPSRPQPLNITKVLPSKRILNTTCKKCHVDQLNRPAYFRHRLRCTEELTSTFKKVTSCTFPSCSKSFPNFDSMKNHRLLQHPPQAATPQASEFKCDYCIKSFRFIFGYRIHLLTAHRVDLFTNYAPPSTSRKQLEAVIKQSLRVLSLEGVEGSKCGLCDKSFKKESETENHLMINHFDEVAVHLRDILDGNLPGEEYFNGGEESGEISVV